MKPSHSLMIGLLLSISGLGASHLSFAFSEFAYTSNELAWESSLLYSEDYDSDAPLDGAEPPQFSFSFLLPAGAPKNTSLSVEEVDVWVNPEFFGWLSIPLTAHEIHGSVQLDSKGMPLAWDFAFLLRELVTPENSLQAGLRDLSLYIRSSGGADSCNCDKLQRTSNVYTQRPQNTWLIIGPLEVNYAADNQSTQWKKTSVPEPQAWALLLSAGLLVGLARRRREARKTLRLH